jgi:hypothetical protein
MIGAALIVALTNTSVGLAGASVVAEDVRSGWLLLPPAAILVLAYRAYLSEHTKHRSLEFLYGVARSLSRAPDVETALVDLLERTRDAFRVAVEDRGRGVEPSFVPRLFERFSRSDQSRTRTVGTGLGLAIAHSYARAHDGQLVYVDARPHGARFELVLPV